MRKRSKGIAKRDRNHTNRQQTKTRREPTPISSNGNLRLMLECLPPLLQLVNRLFDFTTAYFRSLPPH